MQITGGLNKTGFTEISTITGPEAEAFFREEAMVEATMQRRAADNFLDTYGFKPLDDNTQPFAKILPLLKERDLLDESGGLLLSAEATLRPNPNSGIYFLGLNPGGETSEEGGLRFPTVYDSLALSRVGVSAWDQDWSRKDASFQPGQSPLQKRFKHVARTLGVAYGDILATNLIFARSNRFGRLSNTAERLAACLPVHKAMLDIVKPRRLWLMGNPNKAGGQLIFPGGPESIQKVIDPEHANWTIMRSKEVEFCGHQMEFCHTPHLSYWDACAENKQELLRFAFNLA